MKLLALIRISFSLSALAVFCAAEFAIVRADDETALIADENSVSDPLGRAMQAQKTTVERLKTVHATGTYEVFLKGNGDRTDNLVAKADLEFFCDNGKLSIDLMVTQEHRKKLPHYPRIVVLHDGKELYVVRYSPRINPTGCAGDIYSNPTQALQLDGFDLRNVCSPSQRMVHVDKLIENLGRDAVTTTRLPDDVIQ